MDINRLIHDAAEMLADSFTKRKISVDFRLGELPNMSLDKNKMIQIFINILKNAYEAIDASDTKDKHIDVFSILAKKGDSDFVRVEVTDNGVGLTSEAKAGAFRFNFSTKGRGTGFGLHDSANYIKAKDGYIEI